MQKLLPLSGCYIQLYHQEAPLATDFRTNRCNGVLACLGRTEPAPAQGAGLRGSHVLGSRAV